MTEWWLNSVLGIVFQVRVTFYFQVRTLQMQAYQMTVNVIGTLHKQLIMLGAALLEESCCKGKSQLSGHFP